MERTEQLLTKAGNENVLLVQELRLKSEQLKVIANTYDDERAQTLQQNRCLQEQLDLAKTKYDVIQSKLDKSELSTNRSTQFDNMQAVLLNVTQSNKVLLKILQRQSIDEHND